MQDTIQTIVNYALSLMGFLGVIGVFIGIPMGIVFLATSGKIKDAKQKKRRVIFGIVLIALPPVLILFPLIAFAIVNTIMTSTTGV